MLAVLAVLSLVLAPLLGVDDFDEDFESQFEQTSQQHVQTITHTHTDTSPTPPKPTQTHTQSHSRDGPLDVDYYDEEEFILPKATAPKPTPKPATTSDTSSSPRVVVRGVWYEEFAIDIAMMGVIVLYAVVYIIGSAWNKSRVNSFAREFGELIKSNFTYIATSNFAIRPSHTFSPTDIVERQSASEYSITATGHRLCAGICITFNLVARQDAFSWLYDIFVGKEGDEVVIEVPLLQLDPINALVVLKDWKETYTTQYGDVSTCTTTTDAGEFGSSFCCVSDVDRAMECVFLAHSEIRSTLVKYKGLVKAIHITNQKQKSTHPCVVRLIFHMPDDIKDLSVLMKMSIFFIDFISRFHLPVAVKQAVEKKRESLLLNEKKEKKQEELQQKRDKEWSNLTEEQKKKKLEREKMRKIKKKAGVVKVMQS